jgi:hypothetical protein
MSSPQLKEEFNGILEKMGHGDKKVRTTLAQRHKGILVEMETDAGARWMGSDDNKAAFCKEVGKEVEFRPRTHSLIAFNAPLTIDPSDPSHLEEICETNHIEKGGIRGMRWAKPPERRHPGQKTGHIILNYVDANAANRAIANGIYVCGRKVFVEKARKEPTRCLKCQGWNHYAAECIAKDDRCGNCAESHRTNQCQQQHRRFCVSCNAEGHASWSRSCSVFLRKLDNCNRRTPENALQFIPTEEPWTWSTRKDEQGVRTATDTYRPAYGINAPHGGEARWDTYIPDDGWFAKTSEAGPLSQRESGSSQAHPPHHTQHA